jgi:hypothetical protein
VPRSNGLAYAAPPAPEEKLALVKALLLGRARGRNALGERQTGSAGLSPAEENPWDNAQPDAEREFFPLTAKLPATWPTRRPPGYAR